MSEHYYSKNPAAAHDEQSVIFRALGGEFHCVTDAGVFSREGLDMGTRILLEALPKLTGRILDLGCGWGPVGTVLGKTYPDAQILMTDINERAVELAARNAQKNGVYNAAALQSDGYAAVEGQFDAIITNPPIRAGKETVYALLDGAKARLTAGGALYAVIRKQQGAESAARHLQDTYPSVMRIGRDKGYWVLRAAMEDPS